MDAYLAPLADDQRAALTRLRDLISQAAPEAEACILYGVPAFRWHGQGLAAFGAAARHCAFYPMSSSVMVAFRSELGNFETSTGAIRFQPDKPLPAALVRKLVRARLVEIGAASAKPKARGASVSAPGSRLQLPRLPMPDVVRAALEAGGLLSAYESRPAYQRNDYLGWIMRAKLPATRERRLARMLDELARGDVYMNMVYRPRKPAP